MSAATPLSAPAFADLLDRLGPFEARPRLAVAVSGGADSLALALLVGDWAAARGGSLLALTVDHRLRAGSAEEAARTAQRLAAAGIRHRVLAWAGEKPATGIQAAARAARYRLLAAACAEEGALHLLVAHHRDDQAETVLQRLARGSGVDGLAAMAAVVEMEGLRLLRPLLDVDPARLRATLAARGVGWIEDPSNANPLFARVRLRKLLPALAAEGIGADRLAATARAQGRAREALEAATARLMAEAVALDPRGFARLDPEPLRRATEELALRALAGVARSIGGGPPPRLGRLERLRAELLAPRPRRRSFAGCLFLPHAGLLLTCREPAAAAPPLPVRGGQAVRWDGRFQVRLSGAGSGWIGALGPAGLAEMRRQGIKVLLPAVVAHGLPALSDENGVCAVPALGYKRRSGIAVAALAHAPARPLAGWPGALVPAEEGIMSSEARGASPPAGGTRQGWAV